MDLLFSPRQKMCPPNKAGRVNRRLGFSFGFGHIQVWGYPGRSPAELPSANPERVLSSSPGLRVTSYPGYCSGEGVNPEGVAEGRVRIFTNNPPIVLGKRYESPWTGLRRIGRLPGGVRRTSFGGVGVIHGKRVL